MSLEEKDELLPQILERSTIRAGLIDWIEYIRLKRQHLEDSEKDSLTLQQEIQKEGNAAGFQYDASDTSKRKETRAKTDAQSNRNKLSYEEFRKNYGKKNLDHSKSLYNKNFGSRKSKTRTTLSQNKNPRFQNPAELAQYIADNVMIDIPENLEEGQKSEDLKLSKVSEKKEQKLQDFVRADKEKSKTLSAQALS